MTPEELGFQKFPMRDDQESHLQRIKVFVEAFMDAKYRGGAAEHGTLLWEHTPSWLALQTIFELIDGLAYQITLYDELRKMEKK